MPYMTTSATVKSKTSWPLPFETNGASYIYQPSTGIFYDNTQKYYYCPKSKLYYSEVDGTYLTQAPPGSEYPFVPFEPPEPSGQPSEEDIVVSVVEVFSFINLFSYCNYRKLLRLSLLNQIILANQLYYP